MEIKKVYDVVSAITCITSGEKKIKVINIDAEGAKAIARALEKNTTLEWLGLFDNNIGDEGAKAIARALEKNTALSVLW